MLNNRQMDLEMTAAVKFNNNVLEDLLTRTMAKKAARIPYLPSYTSVEKALSGSMYPATMRLVNLIAISKGKIMRDN